MAETRRLFSTPFVIDHLQSAAGIAALREDVAGLGEALALLIERNTSAANSWRVSLDADGKLQWAHDDEVTDVQPARNFWQRVQEFFFRAVPKEYY